jgi:hypothetical protein
VAHDLAQLATRRKQCKVMRFNIPHDISTVVAKDVKNVVIMSGDVTVLLQYE